MNTVNNNIVKNTKVNISDEDWRLFKSGGMKLGINISSLLGIIVKKHAQNITKFSTIIEYSEYLTKVLSLTTQSRTPTYEELGIDITEDDDELDNIEIA